MDTPEHHALMRKANAPREHPLDTLTIEQLMMLEADAYIFGLRVEFAMAVLLHRSADSNEFRQFVLPVVDEFAEEQLLFAIYHPAAPHEWLEELDERLDDIGVAAGMMLHLRAAAMVATDFTTGEVDPVAFDRVVKFSPSKLRVLLRLKLNRVPINFDPEM